MQTYATLKTLRSMGYDVTLINLVHPKLKNHKIRLSLKGFLNEVRTLQFACFRFLYFGKHTKKMYSINPKFIPKADYTVVGSDQVWNSDITSPINLEYFLGFDNSASKIAYASSFGKSIWEDDPSNTTYARKALSSFKAISVREHSGVTICRDCFGVESQQLLDPTLVRTDYDELIRSNKRINEIFPFLLVNTEETRMICQEVANTVDLPIYKDNRYRWYFGRSPKRWLKRMKNSSYIITDSFHGLAFSILFHKQFLVVCADNKKFTRLYSLLQLLNLESRYIKSYEDLLCRKDIINSVVDYNQVDSILNAERMKSEAFLKNNIV